MRHEVERVLDGIFERVRFALQQGRPPMEDSAPGIGSPGYAHGRMRPIVVRHPQASPFRLGDATDDDAMSRGVDECRIGISARNPTLLRPSEQPCTDGSVQLMPRPAGVEQQRRACYAARGKSRSV